MSGAQRKVQACVAEGRPAMGVFVRSGSPEVCEIFASLGFEFVLIDMEHSPYDTVPSIAGLVRAIEARGGSPWVRVPQLEPYIIGKVAELGVHGIVVPHIITPEDAQLAVNAVRWPPAGIKGSCPDVRQLDYRWDAVADQTQLLEDAAAIQREIMIIGLIEDADALPHLDDILKTEIHGLWPGTGDMSLTFGRPELNLNIYHPELIAIRDNIVEKCRQYGKPAMTSVSTIRDGGVSAEEAIRTWAPKGIGILVGGTDTVALYNLGKTLLRDVASVHRPNG